MGGERSMGGKGAHLGDLGWPAGRGSSRGRAGRRRRVDDEQDRRRASWGRAGDELGQAGEEQDRRDLAVRWPGRAGIPSNPPAAGSHGRARASASPSAAMLDYAPSHGDGLRPATRRS